MKRYVNTTKYLKRIVIFTDKKNGKTKTRFLRQGQSIATGESIKFIDEGIKIKEVKQVGDSSADTKTVEKE